MVRERLGTHDVEDNSIFAHTHSG